MTLPKNLLLVRHGESQGNVANAAAKVNDYSHFTEEFMNRPGRAWSLSDTGVLQAQAAGKWLRENLNLIEGYEHDEARFYTSPLVRTMQTAGWLDLPAQAEGEAMWRKNRAVRERDWGDIELLPKSVYKEKYPASARKQELDPLYWRPPGGESIADVAGNRVRDFFDTLHRECEDNTVVAVTHGEYIRATHLVITRADDEEYAAWDDISSMRIKNCEIFHYSRYDEHGVLHRKLNRWRRIRPVEVAKEQWECQVNQDWTPLTYCFATSQELRNSF